MGPVGRVLAAVFAGDRRVWRASALIAIPFLVLIAFYCVRPRDYFTGTNSVEIDGYVAQTAPGERLCVPGLQVPAGTARIRVGLISAAHIRPSLQMTLRLGAPTARTIESRLDPLAVPADRASAAVFAIPRQPAHPAAVAATLCLTAAGVVSWGGTPLPKAPSPSPPTAGGRRLAGRVAVWYLPPPGSRRSYLSRIGAILRRAALFRPAPVGPWLYALLLVVVLPGLAVAAVRCLALGVRGGTTKRLGAWVFAIAALNFACWALITPAFQAPDEVDHFAYAQDLVERGTPPSRDPASRHRRWSASEQLALEDESFSTDHQVGDSRVPWLSSQQSFYDSQAARLHPRSDDGGGDESSSAHGPVYYAALAPAYLVATSSPFDELTLMRLTSALLGALTVLFTFLLARELAPGRLWLAVLAALLVAYQPMYGFLSGAVNNDVGVNAGAAGLELLLIMMLRRGVSVALGVCSGALLAVLPFIKGTAYSLYPVAGVALVAALWRHHRRADRAGLVGLVAAGVVVRVLAGLVEAGLHPSLGSAVGPGAAAGAANEALAHPFGFLAYLWEVFLPRLSFMAPHFPASEYPAFVIFVERGWGAFGWYDVFFSHWVYVVILLAMLAVPLLGVVAARREWAFVQRRLPETAILLLVPIAVVIGFESAFYTPHARSVIAEFGRYAFPAIGPLAVLVVASLHAFGRRRALYAGAGLLVAMLALSCAAQLVTLTGFYA